MKKTTTKVPPKGKAVQLKLSKAFNRGGARRGAGRKSGDFFQAGWWISRTTDEIVRKVMASEGASVDGVLCAALTLLILDRVSPAPKTHL